MVVASRAVYGCDNGEPGTYDQNACQEVRIAFATDDANWKIRCVEAQHFANNLFVLWQLESSSEPCFNQIREMVQLQLPDGTQTCSSVHHYVLGRTFGQAKPSPEFEAAMDKYFESPQEERHSLDQYETQGIHWVRNADDFHTYIQNAVFEQLGACEIKATSTDSHAYDQAIKKEVTVGPFSASSSSYKIRPVRADLTAKKLSVLWQLYTPGQCAKCDFGHIKKTISITVPDNTNLDELTVQHYVLGKTWNWANREANLPTFIDTKAQYTEAGR